MTRCGNCGRLNDREALFCEDCGTRLPREGPRPKPPEGFAPAQEETGGAGPFGVPQLDGPALSPPATKGIGLAAWWDQTLGIASPMVSGLIVVLVLVAGIFIFGSISRSWDDGVFWKDVVSFLERSIWIFAGLVFLGSFTGYFYRRNRRTWRWLLPLPIALGVTVLFWVLLEIARIGISDLVHPLLGDLVGLAEWLLPALFVLALIFGYLMVFWITIGERGDEPPRYGKYGRIR